MTVPLVIIAAVARNRVIGRNNGLAWRLPSDLKRFKALTMGKPLLMGRKTYQSIGRPLPGRETIVVTRERAAAIPGVLVAHDLAAALSAAQAAASRMGADEVIIAGGGQIYAQTIGRAARLHITEVDLAPDGDAKFPAIDPAQWREISRQRPQRALGDEAEFCIVESARRDG